MMGLFAEELASSALVSIGHRPGLDAYHDRTLTLLRSPDGARLTARRRKPQAAGGRAGGQARSARPARPVVAAGQGALRRLFRRGGA
jgi:putative ATP-binding cassette transporter